jgi:hypothetical protein
VLSLSLQLISGLESSACQNGRISSSGVTFSKLVTPRPSENRGKLQAKYFAFIYEEV